jgi:predicted DNA-binding transcriptional regulator AlpA
MGKPRHRMLVTSRVSNAHETASYIGVSDSKFAEMRKTGEFPVKPLPYGPYWDRHAVDQWLDTQSGLIKVEPSCTSEGEDAWIKAAQKWGE